MLAAVLLIVSLLAQVPDDSTVIALERTECDGTCPVYKVRIGGDGSVDYEGISGVRVVGHRSRRIAPADVAALAAEFERIGYWQLEDSYREIRNADGTAWSMTDQPTAITSISTAARAKTVEDYTGAPRALRDLEKRIDLVAGTETWVFIDTATVTQLARAGWNPRSEEAVGLLMRAAESGDLEVASALLDAGVDPNADAPRLLLAGRSAAMIRLLVSRGADVNVATRRGVVPGITPLMQAARNLDVDAVRVLVEAGADVNAVDSSGRSPLMNAAIAGNPDVVRLLLAAGALRFIGDRRGLTALEFAMSGARDEVVFRPNRERMRAAGYEEPTPDVDAVIRLLTGR